MTQPDAIAVPREGAHSLRRYYERHEQKIGVAFFSAGFLLDFLTVARIDSWLTVGQQLLYLAVITVVLTQTFLEQGKSPRELDKMHRIKRWYFEYRAVIASFLFGTLLNLYTIFFFKSASLLVAFSFMVALVLLLLANESRWIKSRLGLAFNFALLAVCIASFCAQVIPILLGSIGTLVFLLSMLVAALPLALIGWRIGARARDLRPRVRQQVLVPAGIVLLAFLVAYVLRVIPPVPLSIPFIGVYHAVERTDEGYRLGHQQPWWRFWHHGDQQFLAQPGDKVYVFFRIFSPTDFADQVLIRWYWKDGTRRWALQDSIPINIVGGRELGFRGYGVKGNYQSGHWRVQIETTDEREIGRIYFRLEVVPEAPRRFMFDLQ